jgi:hypothetical protein
MKTALVSLDSAVFYAGSSPSQNRYSGHSDNSEVDVTLFQGGGNQGATRCCSKFSQGWCPALVWQWKGNLLEKGLPLACIHCFGTGVMISFTTTSLSWERLVPHASYLEVILNFSIAMVLITAYPLSPPVRLHSSVDRSCLQGSKAIWNVRR